MRYYSSAVQQRVKQAPKTLGTQLMRLAIKHQISIVELSQCTGACRQSLYSWAAGHEVSNAYKPQVQSLIKKLKAPRVSL
jgi:NADH:ubiquinone oxidoreductase subunit E